MSDLTHDELIEMLTYDLATGIFVWKIQKGKRAKTGQVAGAVNGKGRVYIKINGIKYSAHRLAWFYVHGSWPESNIDHIDGNPLNNSINNLRLATQSQNMANSCKPKSNTSGYKGVSYIKREKKYCAQIRFEGVQKHIGYFSNPEDAHEAYCKEAKKLFGKFARFE